MANIFRNSTSSIPKSDPQIVRVDMESSDIGGRKSHLPGQMKSDSLGVSHVPNQSSTPGGGK